MRYLIFSGRIGAGALVLGMLLGLAPSAALGHNLVDGVEHLFGASNVGAVTGHGRMAVGVSRDGDLTVLVWPNPSYADQLGYLNSNALDARDRVRFGAPPGSGLVLGLLVERQGGSREVRWLGDRGRWEITQSYGQSDGPNVETVHRSAELKLEVTVVDAVRPMGAEDPAGDVLVRAVRIRRDPASPVARVWLLTYANLSPVPANDKLSELPVVDWALDGRNDFAAVWSESEGAVLHFHPRDQRIHDDITSLIKIPAVDFGVVGAALLAGTPSAQELAALVEGLDKSFAPGVYLALGTVPRPDQHQVGYDETPLCAALDEILDNILSLPAQLERRGVDVELPVDPAVFDSMRCRSGRKSFHEALGWAHPAADAWGDAADGELQGSGIAAGEVNEVLRTPVEIDAATGEGRVAVLLTAGPDAATARKALVDASQDPYASVVLAASEALQTWLADRRLPASASAEVLAVARRSLINIRVGTDLRTGAIVASITRQPPYGLDWPRDGAFFNVLLDISGQPELVARRAALYDLWQRKVPVAPTPLLDPKPPLDPDTGRSDTYPAGAWEMNHYYDGTPGGFDRIEIDEVGFALWTIVSHVGWVNGDPKSYLREHWGATVLAADLLARWRDAENGLQAPAQEDDNLAYSQTLHGAVTTYGGLDIAARAARLLGEDQDAARWEARAKELREAILSLLWDPKEQRFVSEPVSDLNPGSRPTGPTAWLVYPMRLLPWSDPRVEGQIRFDLEAIRPSIELKTQGGAYVMKTTLSAALARGTDPELRPKIQDMLTRLAASASPGTRHFGEVFVVREGEDGPRADQRTATPHLWEGALFYLSAMALEDPEAFLRYDEVLPASGEPAPVPDGLGGEPAPEAGADVAASEDPGEGGVVGDEGSVDRVAGGGGCSAGGAGLPPVATPLMLLLALCLAARRPSRIRSTRAHP